MSRVAPALARRLDRLARRAHAFHRHAHHPLCAAYAGETFRLGRRTRLCRGCALAAAGAALGATLALALPVPPPAALVGALALAVPAALAAVRRHRPGASKLLTRTAPLALAAALVTAGLRSGGAAGLAVAAGALGLAALAVARYRRRGPDRQPCQRCPERALPRACSGFAPMARREAAFVRLAGRLVREVPPGPPPR